MLTRLFTVLTAIGKIVETKNTAKNLSLAVIIGTAVLYLIGIPYIYYILNIMLYKSFTLIQILNMGMFMFIPGDAIKSAIAVFVGRELRNRI